MKKRIIGKVLHVGTCVCSRQDCFLKVKGSERPVAWMCPNSPTPPCVILSEIWFLVLRKQLEVVFSNFLLKLLNTTPSLYLNYFARQSSPNTLCQLCRISYAAFVATIFSLSQSLTCFGVEWLTDKRRWASFSSFNIRRQLKHLSPIVTKGHPPLRRNSHRVST